MCFVVKVCLYMMNYHLQYDKQSHMLKGTTYPHPQVLQRINFIVDYSNHVQTLYTLYYFSLQYSKYIKILVQILFLKLNLIWLCENAWLPWQLVMEFSRMGLYLQNQSYLSCYLSYYTKLGSKLKVRYMPFNQWPEMQMI